MERLPLELLSQISLLSCTDGGLTGCSLSLTSRYIHDAAENSRWHSLAFHSIHQFLVFADHLSDDVSTRRRPVRHLYISSRPQEKADEEELQRLPFSRVFRAIAPSLQTFTCHAIHPIHIGHHILSQMEDIPWPKLTECTVRDIPSHKLRSIGIVSRSAHGLARVHFVGWGGIAHMVFFMFSTQFLPAATHLRFSGPLPYDLPVILETALRHRQEYIADSSEAGVPTPLLPPGLRHIVLQPALGVDHEVIAANLDAVKKVFALRDGLFTVLPPHFYDHTSAFQDWLDRVGGGHGCWSAVGG